VCSVLDVPALVGDYVSTLSAALAIEYLTLGYDAFGLSMFWYHIPFGMAGVWMCWDRLCWDRLCWDRMCWDPLCCDRLCWVGPLYKRLSGVFGLTSG